MNARQSIENRIKRARDSYHRDFYRLSRAMEYAEEIEEIAQKWISLHDPDDKDVKVDIDVDFISIDLNIRLAKDESFNSYTVQAILEFMREMGYYHTGDFDDTTSKLKSMHWRKPEMALPVYLRFWYGKSDKCKLIPTGEKKDIYKLECE